MRTIEILLKLIHSIKQNPNIISLLPFDDLQICICTEIQSLENYYSSEHLQSINNFFIHYLSDLKQNATTLNVQGVTLTLEKIIQSLELLPRYDYLSPTLQQSNFDHACLHHYKNDTIIVLGDSHVNFFSGNEDLSFLPIGNDINTCSIHTGYPFTPLHLGPCLAYTCNKTGSTYHFKEKTDYLCNAFIKPHARIICCLGEIDIRVHVYNQTIQQNKSYETIIDDILTQYTTFLRQLQSKGYTVYCWGPIASQTESCPVDAQFPRNGSEIYRNKVTEYFNNQLRLYCYEHNIGFLSIFEQMITNDYHTIEHYLSADHCHLSQSALSLAQTEWKKII